ncbi:hypothetical protein IV203_015640 [Nitzschia inconspicua]|uniref:Tyrosine-protein kinase ephrin type A/B receptor-like domain-containing protein n=1 Tax=Nitzschia inconspicua TaxID=303405 RepID=A0A9K3PTN6_9STRA|nr:hypothetical protein IV203_015640 [Nitzschia inconspicua]
MPSYGIVIPLMMFVVVFLSVLSAVSSEEQPQRDYTYEDLRPCTMSSQEIGTLGPNDDLEPCIIYEVLPTFLEDQLQGQLLHPKEPLSGKYNLTSVISMVQVTPSYCFNHRDGAPTGVQFLNRDNNGRGVAIGFASVTADIEENDGDNQELLQQDQRHYLQFHFVSVVAGNPNALSQEEYDRRHVQILKSMISDLDAPYIVGTCSFASTIEKEVAEDSQAFLMAQVGPPGFYMDNNPYVFGIHIDSDLYPLPTVQSLTLLSNQERRDGLRALDIPIKIIYRDKSEFFYSTCRSAFVHLKAAGFKNVEEIIFDHSGDHDNDGVANEFDEDFLVGLADQACVPHPTQDHGDDDGLDSHHPALFVCTLTEQDIMIRRWLEIGCRPMSMWATAATWGWADENPDLVPYFQGGGQWHPAFTYNDMYFQSGSELLDYNQRLYGYAGSYDQVVNYAIPVLFAQHLVAAYRVADDPDPISDFASSSGREALRRDMMVLKADTIFGPVSFDENQRNNGRDAAGTQWLPITRTESVEEEEEEEEEEEVEKQIQFVRMGKKPELQFANRLVAPFLQAEAATVVVADSAKRCSAGSFVNETMWVENGSILKNGCNLCPVDTFQPEANVNNQCNPCPSGSNTKGDKGQEICYAVEENCCHLEFWRLALLRWV